MGLLDVLRWMLLEDPIALWTGLAIAEAVVLAVWWRTRGRRATRALLVLPAVGLLLGLLDGAVVTDYERLRTTLQAMGEAVEAADPRGVLTHVSEDYAGGRYDKADLAALADAGLRHLAVRTDAPEIRMRDGRAVVTGTYSLAARPGAPFQIPYEFRRITWEGTFALEPDGAWRLVSVTMTRPRRVQPEAYLPVLRGQGARGLPR